MKIKYESTKRKKDIARSKIAYQKYAKSIDEPIELQIYEELHRFFHKENYPVAGAIQDATSLYYAFQSIYNLAAKYKYYIDNDINTTFQYYRMGAIYYAMAYQEMQQACQVDEIVTRTAGSRVPRDTWNLVGSRGDHPPRLNTP